MKLPALILAALLLAAPAAPAAIPVEHFFATPQMSAPALSPNGRYLAFRAGDANNRDSMVILELDTMKVAGGARLDGEDIGKFRWVNDKRLVFTIHDRTVPPGDERYAPGLFAVNRDGSDLRRLADRDWAPDTTGTMIKRRVQPWNTFLMHQDGAQDSDFIYVRRPVWQRGGNNATHVDLVRLDTSNGLADTMHRPPHTMRWLLDAKGEPRLAVAPQKDMVTIHYREADGRWRVLSTFKAYGSDASAWEPLGFADDKTLYVTARRGGDKSALHTIDLATGALSAEPVVSASEFDFEGDLVFARGKLVGLRVETDASSTVWFDPALKAAQAKIDAQMPATVNEVTPPVRANSPWLLVASYSDRQPVVYSVFNTQSGTLSMLGQQHPQVKAPAMAQQDLVRFKARDGLVIPAWLTVPNGGAKMARPLVVLVHGGPFVRGGSWGWDPEGQFLASRGYAVLEPEFRGSTGYGHQLFDAGRKQWGRAMQDDLLDAVKWAVQQGIADPKRVCIMGGSYGGYATLMGLVRDGEAYRCGVAWAAVADIPMLFDKNRSFLGDISDNFIDYGAPELVGDFTADAAAFAEVSPLKQAARIKRPLLLTHGSDDLRVLPEHGRLLHAALRKEKANVEYVEYPGEGHGWSTLKTRVDFWTRVEQFLSKHMKP